MMTMSTGAHIVRGAATRMCGRAANDNASPRRSLVMQSRLGVPAAGVIAAFSLDRELFRLERRLSARSPLHEPDESDYDDLLGLVGTEMALPSA
jgi:hypothetical protein